MPGHATSQQPPVDPPADASARGAALAWAVAAVALALGTWLRARDLGGLLLYGDELHSLALSRASYGRILTTFEPFGSGLALPLAQRVALDLLGPSLLAFRLPTLLAGVATLPVLFVFARRRAGATAAALATLALALAPLHVYHSHFARAYPAAALLGLGLLAAVARTLEAPRPGRRPVALGALAAGLLPFVHGTTAGFVVAVAVAAALWLVGRGAGRARWRAVVALFGGGLGLALLLHLPAADEVLAFLANKAANRPDALSFGAFDVAVRTAGSPAAAAVWVAGALASALWLLRVHPGPGVLLVLPALLPIAILAAVRPVGGVYAYARYGLVVLPLLCLLPAWGLVGLARRLAPPRWAEPAALLVGTAAIALAFAASPLGRGASAGPFANMPQTLHGTPDADPPPSPVYDAIAADAGIRRIAEVPFFTNWRLGRYREAWLHHGREVWLGAVGPPPFERLEGPYLDVRDPARVRAAGVDALVVHRDVERERTGEPGPRVLGPAVLRALRARYGPPDHEDAHVLVWRLVGRGPSGRSSASTPSRVARLDPAGAGQSR